jgi:hypothetical protein
MAKDELKTGKKRRRARPRELHLHHPASRGRADAAASQRQVDARVVWSAPSRCGPPAWRYSTVRTIQPGGLGDGRR